MLPALPITVMSTNVTPFYVSYATGRLLYPSRPSHLSLYPPPYNVNRRLPICLPHGRQALLAPLSPCVSAPSDLVDGKKLKDGFLEIKMQVREYELDQYGVVNNAVYSSYCQHAHYELLGYFHHADAAAQETLAVSELSLKFLNPLRSGDKFLIKVKVLDYSIARIFIQHFIYKLSNQEPILEAKSTVLWLDNSYRPIRIPSEVKYKLNQLGWHK